MEQRNKLQSERLDFLLDALKEDSIQYKNLQVGNSETEKRNAVRSLMNVRMPRSISDDFLEVQDIFLQEEAKEKGIRISFIDSYTEEPVQDLTVATDNLEAGEKLGKFAASLLGPDDQIAIVAHVKGVSTAVEREEGFRKGLGDLADNIVEVVYCDSQYEKSRKLTNELMQKYPNLKMIAGMNEYSSVGAARAVKAAGAKDRIQVVGVDSSQEAVQLMENGVFKALVVQKAFKMGYMGVKETVRMLRGKDYEKDVNSGCELVTPDNMYNSEIEKLLFPFNTLKLS